MRRIVVFVIVLALCAPLSACGSSAKPPHTLRGRIVAAALAQKSVRWTLTDSDYVDPGSVRADVNADSGRERLSISGDVVRVLLVDDTVFFHGGYEGCLSVLELTPAQAERCRGRWISIPRGYRPYRALADSLTFGWIVRHAVPRGPLTKSFTRKPHGTRLLVLEGGGVPNAPFAYRLTARASGEPLPVGSSYASASFGGGAGGTGEHSSSRRRFSRWNEPVNVQAPENSTPIATVRG